MGKILITETPEFNFEVRHGIDNRIVITLGADLFGHALRFIVYKELGQPKLLDFALGEKLNFITYFEDAQAKTQINLLIDKTDSTLIPMLKAPLKQLCEEQCGLVPTCYYDLIGTANAEEYPVLNGFIQGTPTGKGAI